MAKGAADPLIRQKPENTGDQDAGPSAIVDALAILEDFFPTGDH